MQNIYGRCRLHNEPLIISIIRRRRAEKKRTATFRVRARSHAIPFRAKDVWFQGHRRNTNNREREREKNTSDRFSETRRPSGQRTAHTMHEVCAMCAPSRELAMQKTRGKCKQRLVQIASGELRPRKFVPVCVRVCECTAVVTVFGWNKSFAFGATFYWLYAAQHSLTRHLLQFESKSMEHLYPVMAS